MMSPLEQLHELRTFAGPRQTVGLSDAALRRLLPAHPLLAQAIDEAAQAHAALRTTPRDRADAPSWAALLAGDESELLHQVQADLVNFYAADAVNPYCPLAARGPWIVTSHGAVLHDSGGYGMLGFGHAPQEILDAMQAPVVMANVMTPSFSLARFTDALRAEIGHSRPGGCPFTGFVCMNSGSEAVTVAARISDLHARRLTEPGQRHEGKKIRFLGLRGGFHGRTDRPAQASSSSRSKYQAHLASFRDREFLVEVPPNDIQALRAVFAQADADNVFFEMMLMEPVMGEGNPGLGITRAFYDEARRLTREHGALLLVDSIQAGLRTHGVLSLVDYPGFADAEAPDMETWSKALNAAQYPLSVLGLSARAASLYTRGVYGNTMTGNPRALEVGTATLRQITPELRANVAARGRELVAALEGLRAEFPHLLTHIQGTGLLVSAEIHPAIPVVGDTGIETWCRKQGLGVIHGGENSLRFTPHFRIASDEVALMVDVLREALRAFAPAVPAAAK